MSRDLLPVIAYSDKFFFPLTAHEIWFWQIKSQYSLLQVRQMLSLLKKKKLVQTESGYYSLLPIHDQNKKRKQVTYFSRQKWQKINNLKRLFSQIPFIQAIFVTGTLSVNNASRDDDIDLMVVTKPYTLWITRAFLVTILKILHLRRLPGINFHTSPLIANKICDNIWLEASALSQNTHSLYIAHEILQAQPLIDKANIRFSLLTQNSWAKEYLPMAYNDILKKCSPPQKRSNLPYIIFLPINLLFYYLQRLYMTPRITTEKISFKNAYFHTHVYKDL